MAPSSDSLPTGMYTLSDLHAAIAANPQQWRPLALTNGCFDLLHVGHVRYLQAAKARAKTLVVGINSDDSVRSLKGATRPIVPASQRAELIASLKAVDAVFIFAERTASESVRVLRPDLYIKGGDYTPDTLPEAEAVRACGGRIELVQIEVPTSTTNIVRRILELENL